MFELVPHISAANDTSMLSHISLIVLCEVFYPHILFSDFTAFFSIEFNSRTLDGHGKVRPSYMFLQRFPCDWDVCCLLEVIVV